MYKVDFVHANSYLLKLQISHVILDGHGQAFPKRLWKPSLKNNTVTEICLFISTLGANDVMLI